MQTKYVGEIGLDFSKQFYSTKSEQIEAFEKIIELCNNLGGKVLSIHSRFADNEVLKQLEKLNETNKDILHWYSGSLKNLSKAVEKGIYFSINEAMFNSENGLKIIKSLPEELILTESDGPFAQVKNTTLSPLNINGTVSKLAIHLKKEQIEVKSQVYRNFKTLLENL